ncbi:MAG: coenzyme F420-0:L-glutamate ligase [Thermoproteota archaeon]
MKTSGIWIIGIEGIKIVEKGDDLAAMVIEAAKKQGTPIKNGDIIVLTSKAVSKSEGRIYRLRDIKKSVIASLIAEETGKTPEHVQAILREAKRIIRLAGHHLITETKSGFIVANSGVDLSNVDGGESIVALPKDPDASARRFRSYFKRRGLNVGVILSDTHGRPFRRGDINIAIGSAGITPIADLRGKKDLCGYKLKVKQIAIVDELASAAELVTGSANEAVPVAIIRGYKYKVSSKGAKILVRPMKQNLFV